MEWTPVQSVRTGFGHAELASLDGEVAPHTLRIPAQPGWCRLASTNGKLPGSSALTVVMFDRVCGHHHWNHLRTAAKAIGYTRAMSIVGTASEVSSRSR
jgi:hypothetical protein